MLREFVPEPLKPLTSSRPLQMQCIPTMLRTDCHLYRLQSEEAVLWALLRLKAQQACEGWSNTDEQARIANYIISNSGFGQKHKIWQGIERANRDIERAAFCRLAKKMLEGQ
jgi:hypothetical protein